MKFHYQFFILIWIVVGVAVLTTIVLIVRSVKKRSNKGTMDFEYIEGRKQAIEQLVTGETETEYAMALIEADKLLDHMLKMRQFAGTTLGERLKVAGYKHPKLKAIWPAHLMRNRMVHEHNVTLGQSQIKKLWKQYQDAYRILSR